MTARRPNRHDRTDAHDTRGASAGPVFLPPAPPIRSPRAATVAQWFGLINRPTSTSSPTPQPAASHSPRLSLPPPRTITLITGPSGAGKSSLLRELMRSRRRRWIDAAALELPDRPLVDCFDERISLIDVLLLLSRVGLGEAWTYLRKPSELSDGQHWRAKLALAIRTSSTRAHGRARLPVVVADEFAALLDRVTATVVARALRRTIDASPNLSAVVATSHEDLAAALRPDTIIHCDFGRRHVEETALG